MDEKKQRLLAAAHEVFLAKGYKETNVATIAKVAGIAVGSFYKYYQAKEDIFIEIYIAENDRIRNLVISSINWDGDPIAVVNELFAVTIQLTATNQILSEWSNPSLAPALKDYYYQQRNTNTYAFHQFLMETFKERLIEKQFDQTFIDKLLKVYDFIYYIDCHVNEELFPGYTETFQILVQYFIKGVFA